MASKEPYILLSLYQNLYKDKYGKAPSLNKYKEKWAMQDVVDSIGYDRAKKVLEYYFETGKDKHPLQFFYFNFDRLEDMMLQIEEDKVLRNIILENTRKLVKGDE